ncbi:MAG TPA: formimidoylglutamate deiminase [Longimicrobiales bacterium]|nr:formimidoylglutamate deiminase [Longimicrobiales bacterium]
MPVLLPDLVYHGGTFHRDHAVEYDRDGGRIVRVGPAHDLTDGGVEVERLPARALLPGFVNAHSHAFQRGIRGHTQWRPTELAARSDFWTWREAMYAAAARLSADEVGQVSRFCFLEMLRAGITTVGEFHYLHRDQHGEPYPSANELAHRVVMAAEEVGIRIVLINVAYVTGSIGQPLSPQQARFATPDLEEFLERTSALAESVQPRPRVRIALAAHSLRAVPREWLSPLHEWATRRDAPFHIHVSEQTAEVEACRAEFGLRPVQVLAAEGLLGPRLTAVHATHIDDDEVIAIGDSGTNVCACPTTERDLGDGFLRGHDLAQAGAHLALGSDSQTIIDFFEEMRLVEYNERLQRRRRNVIVGPPTSPDRVEPAAALLRNGTADGARALGVDSGRIEAGALADFFTVDLTNPAVAGWTEEALAAMLVFSAPPQAVSDVWVGGVRRLTDARHALDGVAAITFRDITRRLFQAS